MGKGVKYLGSSLKLKPNTKAYDRMMQWRRDKVLELSSQGHNQVEIANILKISKPTVSRDVIYLNNQAKSNIKRYIDETLPCEYEKCLTGLNAILKEAWNTANNTDDNREKMQALALAMQCYAMKLELLTNATVVDDAIRFVSQYQNQNQNQQQKQDQDQNQEQNTSTTNETF